MPIQILTPITVAKQQIKSYNDASGARAKNEFSLGAGAAWAVNGTIVADAATVEDVPTLEAAVEALAEVQVAIPLCWGQAPAEILPADHETVLAIEANVLQTISFGGGRGQVQRSRHVPTVPIKPPAGKKFVVWGFKVPTSLDAAGIAALEAAVQGAHAGITSAHHLMDGVTDAELVGNATLTITAHTRIDAVESEP